MCAAFPEEASCRRDLRKKEQHRNEPGRLYVFATEGIGEQVFVEFEGLYFDGFGVAFGADLVKAEGSASVAEVLFEEGSE